MYLQFLAHGIPLLLHLESYMDAMDNNSEREIVINASLELRKNSIALEIPYRT